METKGTGDFNASNLTRDRTGQRLVDFLTQPYVKKPVPFGSQPEHSKLTSLTVSAEF